MAFQPIVDVKNKRVYAYEALVRGVKGEPFATVYQHVNESNLYQFDQHCRVTAVRWASQLEIPCFLSINFFPNAVYQPELCIRTTIAACEKYQFPKDRIIFEITEHERVVDLDHLNSIVEHYQAMGLNIALDDFGAGYAGLNVLVKINVNVLKVDMALIRDIHNNKVKQSLLRAIMQMAKELNYTIIAEGVETIEEYRYIRAQGVELFQGFLFAKPGFECLPEVTFPSDN